MFYAMIILFILFTLISLFLERTDLRTGWRWGQRLVFGLAVGGGMKGIWIGYTCTGIKMVPDYELNESEVLGLSQIWIWGSPKL